MSFKKPFVNNRKVDYRFNRRIIATRKMVEIDRRCKKINDDQSLYARLYRMTRDNDPLLAETMSVGCSILVIGCYTLSLIIFGAWAGYSADAGNPFALPLYLLAASSIFFTWLFTIKQSYNGYLTAMNKYYSRRLEKLDVARNDALPRTFMNATTLALGKTDEFEVVPVAKFSPGLLDELYAAYKDKVDAIDSLKYDTALYDEGFNVLVSILKQDTKDIRAVDSELSESKRKARDLQAAAQRKQRRAEVERAQNVLNDLRNYHDTYKQLGA